MVRTQISLEEDAYREAKAAARRQGVSLAEFLRRAVAAALGPRQPARRSWMRYAGAVSSGDPGSSQSVNEVVYADEEIERLVGADRANPGERAALRRRWGLKPGAQRRRGRG